MAAQARRVGIRLSYALVALFLGLTTVILGTAPARADAAEPELHNFHPTTADVRQWVSGYLPDDGLPYLVEVQTSSSPGGAFVPYCSTSELDEPWESRRHWECAPSSDSTSPRLEIGDNLVRARATNLSTAETSEWTAPVTVTLVAFTIDEPEHGMPTVDRTPVFSGTSAFGSSLWIDWEVFGYDMCTSAIDESTREWSCESLLQLDPGEHTYIVTLSGGVPAGQHHLTVEPVLVETPEAGSTSTQSTPSFSGLVDPDFVDEVEVRAADGSTVWCIASVAPDGSWQCQPTTPLPEGTHSYVLAVAPEGFESAERTLTILPHVPAPVIANNIPRTLNNRLWINGEMPNDGNPYRIDVEHSINSGVTFEPYCSVGLIGFQYWECQPSTATSEPRLSVGTNHFRARATNLDSGLTSQWSEEATVLLEEFSIITPAAGDWADATPTFSGTSSFEGPLQMWWMETPSFDRYVCGAPVIGGTWECDSEVTFPPGSHTVYASSSIPGVSSDLYTFYVGPLVEAPLVDVPVVGSVMNDALPLFAGTADPTADTVEVRATDGDTVWCAATINPDGTWQCQPTRPLPEGTHSYYALVSPDGTSSTARTLTIDTQAPNPPVITTPTTEPVTQISGTGEPAATLTLSNTTTITCTTDPTIVTPDGTWLCD